MQNEKKKKTQSNLLTTGGALAGAALGTIVAGPLGSVGGALAGTLVEKAVEWGVNEIHTRFLTNSEKRKVTSLIDCSIKKSKKVFLLAKNYAQMTSLSHQSMIVLPLKNCMKAFF